MYDNLVSDRQVPEFASFALLEKLQDSRQVVYLSWHKTGLVARGSYLPSTGFLWESKTVLAKFCGFSPTLNLRKEAPDISWVCYLGLLAGYFQSSEFFFTEMSPQINPGLKHLCNVLSTGNLMTSIQVTKKEN